VSGPLPPPDIGEREPLIQTVATGSVLSRFYSKRNGPIYFDRSLDGRLNAPDASYGVLYAAKDVEGAFAETFLRRAGAMQIARDFVEGKALVTLRAARALKLVKLHGNGLARLGATAEVTHSGTPYDVPHEWSLALHAHKGEFDGIAYNARHDDDEVCYAIFERSKAKLAEISRDENLDQNWFYEITEHHGVSVAPAWT
jgi:RES domain